MRRHALLSLALGAICLLAAPAAAQWPPDTLRNLQVLPDTLPVPELTRLMAGFTRALGVRCSTCHVGEENRPLATYDFASDEKPLKRKAREMLRMKQDLNRILSAHTGKPIEQVQTDTDRDYFMSGEEARSYGIVDNVIAKRDDLGGGTATEKKDDA